MKLFTLKCSILIALAIIGIAAVIYFSPYSEPPSLLDYADARTFFGIPNALDVLSNAFFILVGLIGFGFLCRKQFPERLFYFIFFVGVFFTGLGSAYYHWVLGNGPLVWDRIPITIAIMGLFCAIIGERVSLRAAFILILPLLIVGVATVFYWYYTDKMGYNDIGPYTLVQIYPALAIALILLMFRSPYTNTFYLWLSLLSYFFARLFELFDRQIYIFTDQLVSGHTLKHLFAALACYFVYVYLARRRLLS